ncbi:MAG: DUF3095 domain-containing protein [Leptospiraceae bacterium]|nr:DUF3095 domain-containing protein [Leptospiraceae bacterium]
MIPTVPKNHNEHFYRNLPAENSLQDILKRDLYTPVPPDWLIVITDVKGSTQAIQEGRYKDVNVAGALGAIAISNEYKDMNFPFVFGGDGVTVLLPASLGQRLRDILYDTGQQVKKLYDLDLRLGIVPVADVYAAGLELSVAKLGVSRYYNQAIIQGNGIQAAERWIKSPEGERYLIRTTQNPAVRASFEGFTCRWQDIPSQQGETIAMIVQLRSMNPESRQSTFLAILDQINAIFGQESEYHPLYEAGLAVSSDRKILWKEAAARSGQRTGLRVWIKYWQIKIETLITRLAIRYHIGFKAYWYNLAQLKDYQILSCDFKKYDGTLKMVIAGQTADRRRLQAWFDGLYKDKKIYYGLHVSDRALITCLLHAGSRREVHFVDGADGGYALASKALKAQIESSAP